MGKLIEKIRSNPTVDLDTAAEILGIGRDAVRKAAKNGDLPTIKLNNRYRVPTIRLLRMVGLDNSEAA